MSRNPTGNPVSELAAIIADLRARVTSLEQMAHRHTGALARMELGSYTPTLTGMVVGTGGGALNSASWVFTYTDAVIGGPTNVHLGILSLSGAVVFGTSGQTFPTIPSISLPTDFHLAVYPNPVPVGHCRLTNEGIANNFGRMWANVPSFGDQVIVPIAAQADSTYVVERSLTTAVPFTWGQDDRIDWDVNLLAYRPI